MCELYTVKIHRFDIERVLELLSEVEQNHPLQSTRWNASYLHGQIKKQLEA